jgi:hypothetical protein
MSNEQFIPQEYSISAAQQQSRLPRAQDRYDSDLFYDASGQPSRYTSVADTPSISQSPTPAYPSRHTALTENSMSEQEELEQHQRAAILQWGRRAKACFAIQLISALCLLHSIYWYSTVIGLVILIGLLVFAYSIKQQQTNFVRVYVLIVLVNLAKFVSQDTTPCSIDL